MRLSPAQLYLLQDVHSGNLLKGSIRPRTGGKRNWYIFSANGKGECLAMPKESTVLSLERLGLIERVKSRETAWRDCVLTQAGQALCDQRFAPPLQGERLSPSLTML